MAEEEYSLTMQEDISGGLDLSSDPSKVPPHRMIVMNNFYYDPVKKAIVKRSGFTKWVATAADSNDRVKSLVRFYSTDKARLWAGYDDQIAGNGRLKFWDTSSNSWYEPGGVTHSGSAFNFAAIDDMLVIAAGGTNDGLSYWSAVYGSTGDYHTLGTDVMSGPTLALTSGASDMADGVYNYAFAYANSALGHEGRATGRGAAGIEITAGSLRRVLITLPAAPGGQWDYMTIYRTQADGIIYYELAKQAYATPFVDHFGDDTLTGECESWDNYPVPSPILRVMAHKSRIFALSGIDGGGGSRTSHSTLYFSKPLQPYAFPQQNYIQFDRRDNDPALEVAVFAGRVFVFKRPSFGVLTYNIDPLDGSVEYLKPGTAAADTVVVTGALPGAPVGAMIWLGSDNRVYLHNGATFQSISEGIQVDLDGLSETAQAAAKGMWQPDRRWYILSIDTDADGENDTTYVFGLESRTWSKFDYGMAAMALFDGPGDTSEVVGASKAGDTDGSVYQLQTGTTDGGSAIAASLVTPMLAFGAPGHDKQLRSVFNEFLCESGKNVTLNIYRHRETTAAQTITLTGDGSLGQAEVESVNIDPSKSYRLQWLANSPTVFELFRYGIERIVRRLGLRSGSVAGGVGPGNNEV